MSTHLNPARRCGRTRALVAVSAVTLAAGATGCIEAGTVYPAEDEGAAVVAVAPGVPVVAPAPVFVEETGPSVYVAPARPLLPVPMELPPRVRTVWPSAPTGYVEVAPRGYTPARPAPVETMPPARPAPVEITPRVRTAWPNASAEPVEVAPRAVTPVRPAPVEIGPRSYTPMRAR